MPTTAELAALAAARAPEVSLPALLAEELPGNALTTLLLHAMRERARARTSASIAAASALPIAAPSAADARRFHAIDAALFAAAADFPGVELSPVLPLGATAAHGTDPNNVLTALRFTEVASDPTVGLGLHLARLDLTQRRRACASQRVLRMQPLAESHFKPHFRLIALAAVERSTARALDDAVDLALLAEQISAWVRLLTTLRSRMAIKQVDVVVSDTRVSAAVLQSRGLELQTLARQAAAHRPGSEANALRAAGIHVSQRFPSAGACAADLGLDACARDRLAALESAAAGACAGADVGLALDPVRIQGASYYRGPMLRVVVTHETAGAFTIGDGGALPWMEAWRSDRRARFVASGLGAEPLASLFWRA